MRLKSVAGLSGTAAWPSISMAEPASFVPVSVSRATFVGVT